MTPSEQPVTSVRRSNHATVVTDPGCGRVAAVYRAARSHSRTASSLPPVASVSPSGLNARALTQPSAFSSGEADGRGRAGSETSQRRVVRSWLHTERKRPSGLKATPSAGPSNFPRVASGTVRPLPCVRHSRARPSRPAAAISEPSGLKATDCRKSSPRNTTGLPAAPAVCAFAHSRTVLSAPAAARPRPSGANTTE